ncbi:thermonuclease family protein [Micavibrio aeruginosavorus]|uniref:thermonuclease family protein n=1 Tax=Micavibrio aeruginosavorus TaxID=349221 RepID=UPI003F4AA811
MIKFILFSIWRKHQSRNRNHIQQEDRRDAHRKNAQSESVLKTCMQDLPLARVKWVIDGDTVIVTQGWKETVIRLDSIDCPEDGQNWGNTAKYGLMKLISRKNVRLEVHGMDHHGRTLATIHLWNEQKYEWLNVNERMVTLGHAWVMRRYYDHLPQDRQNKLNRLERWAQSKKVGLWSEDNPMPPWEWRSGR